MVLYLSSYFEGYVPPYYSQGRRKSTSWTYGKNKQENIEQYLR